MMQTNNAIFSASVSFLEDRFYLTDDFSVLVPLHANLHVLCLRNLLASSSFTQKIWAQWYKRIILVSFKTTKDVKY